MPGGGIMHDAQAAVQAQIAAQLALCQQTMSSIVNPVASAGGDPDYKLQKNGQGGPLRGGSSSPAAPCNGSHSNLLCQLAEANLNNL